MKLKDVMPAIALAKSQRIIIYAAPEGMKLKTIHRDNAVSDPRAAVGDTLWQCEVVQIDATGMDAFNIIVKLPLGRISI